MPGFSSISGISSGLDTDAIVDAIMGFERQPAVLLEYNQAEKTNIISAFKALQAKIIALRTEVALLARTKTFNAASIDVTDESILDAIATGKVGTGSYDIQVLSLARNHQLASQGITDQSLASMGTGTIGITVGDGSQQTVTIDSSNNSLVGIQKAINDADIGVQANIINDGSSSNPYRLVLSSTKTGAANKISIVSSLSGGTNLNFTSGSFDNPETISFDSGTTSAVSLGTTAAFTGDENKIYTFAVQGTGAQTIGTDNITINWSDGTNSGSIIVTQADTEYELVGAGADGLKLSFSAGVLTAGDTFQVTSFAPLLQEASDARLALGSSGGSGSPITVTSETNTFTDVIAGVKLVLKKETDPGESITISTGIDVSAIRNQITSVIQKYNDVMDFIDKQNSYNSDTEESGVLFGDRTVQIMQNSIRSAIGSRISGLDSRYNQLYSVGIRTGADGQLSIRDGSRLDEALLEDLDDVICLFTNAGSTDSTNLEFIAATAGTEIGEKYEINITKAATHGQFQGSGITDPSTTALTLTNANNRLKLSVDGIHSNEIILSEKTYNSSDELVREIQEKIDNDELIGNRGLTVEWVSSGSDVGYLVFTSSTYGSGSKVNIITSIPSSAFSVLGLVTGANHDGIDVEGTINGESATGRGQILTGDEGNATTEGLKIKVTLDADQLGEGAEGTVSVTKGVAARLGNLLESLTAAGDGMLDRRIRAYQNQVDNLKERIEDIDERLALRRESLYKQFYAMEQALGKLNAQGTYLESQIANLNANWSQILGKSNR